jgi:phage N-6-adenine-methyltransferase
MEIQATPKVSNFFVSTGAALSSNDDTWATPRDFYKKLDAEFGFGLDAAALQNSTLVPSNWYGPDHEDETRRNALVRNWTQDSNGAPIWLNPPYGRTMKLWTAKANREAVVGGGTVVLLLPARTDTSWWHDHCIQHEVRFIRGRLKFGNAKNSAPFASAVVIMRG